MEWGLAFIWVLIAAGFLLLLVAGRLVYFFVWSYVDDKRNAPPPPLRPRYYYDDSPKRWARMQMYINRDPHGGCILSCAALAIPGLGLLVWQNLSRAPSSLWFGLGLGLLGLALLPLILVLYPVMAERDGIPDSLQLILAIVIIGGFGLAFYGKDSVPGFYHYYRRPSLPYTALETAVTTNPRMYEPGQHGALTVTVENKANVPLLLRDITLTLPKRFLDGFMIDRDALQQDATVAGRRVVFPSCELASGAVIARSLPVIALGVGDFSGDFAVRIRTSPVAAFRGTHSAAINLTVAIVPGRP
jgi:hypothetical protein